MFEGKPSGPTDPNWIDAPMFEQTQPPGVLLLFLHVPDETSTLASAEQGLFRSSEATDEYAIGVAKDRAIAKTAFEIFIFISI